MTNDFTESFKEKLAAKELENEQAAEAEEYYRRAGRRACRAMEADHVSRQTLAAACLDWGFMKLWLQEYAVQSEITETHLLIDAANEALWGGGEE